MPQGQVKVMTSQAKSDIRPTEKLINIDRGQDPSHLWPL